jgi:hypothetical protein
MVLIYQPPNAHVRISWILLRNAAAVKKIYRSDYPWKLGVFIEFGFHRLQIQFEIHMLVNT